MIHFNYDTAHNPAEITFLHSHIGNPLFMFLLRSEISTVLWLPMPYQWFCTAHTKSGVHHDLLSCRADIPLGILVAEGL